MLCVLCGVCCVCGFCSVVKIKNRWLGFGCCLVLVWLGFGFCLVFVLFGFGAEEAQTVFDGEADLLCDVEVYGFHFGDYV